MAQKPVTDTHIEIEETDQANNLVATYITSPSGEKGSRVDIVVSTISARTVLELANMCIDTSKFEQLC